MAGCPTAVSRHRRSGAADQSADGDPLASAARTAPTRIVAMALLDGIRHRPCCQIGLVGLLITEGVPAGATQNVVLHLLVPAPNSRTRAGPKHCIYGSAKFL